MQSGISWNLTVILLEIFYFTGLTFQITQVISPSPLCMHAWSIAGCKWLGNCASKGSHGRSSHRAAHFRGRLKTALFPWAGTDTGMSRDASLRKGAAVLCHTHLERTSVWGIWSTTMHPPVLCLWECRALMLQGLWDWGKEIILMLCVRTAMWISNQESWGLVVFPQIRDHAALVLTLHPAIHKQ